MVSPALLLSVVPSSAALASPGIDQVIDLQGLLHTNSEVPLCQPTEPMLLPCSLTCLLESCSWDPLLTCGTGISKETFEDQCS